MNPQLQRLRYVAAALALLSGCLQCASPWLLTTSPAVLLAALAGSLYLLLALGLLGISRLSLALAVMLPALRAWFDLATIPQADLDTLRLVIDLFLPLLCLPALWDTLHPDYSEDRDHHDAGAFHDA